MHDHHHEPSVDAGYETSDMNVKVMVALMAVIAGLAVVSFFITILVIRYFDDARFPYGPVREASPLVQEGMQRPDVPYRLQSDPIADRRKLFSAQQEQLEGYAITTQAIGYERGRVHIDNAIDWLVEGKAPYRQPVTNAQLDAPATTQEQPNTTVNQLR